MYVCICIWVCACVNVAYFYNLAQYSYGRFCTMRVCIYIWGLSICYIPNIFLKYLQVAKPPTATKYMSATFQFHSPFTATSTLLMHILSYEGCYSNNGHWFPCKYNYNQPNSMIDIYVLEMWFIEIFIWTLLFCTNTDSYCSSRQHTVIRATSAFFFCWSELRQQGEATWRQKLSLYKTWCKSILDGRNSWITFYGIQIAHYVQQLTLSGSLYEILAIYRSFSWAMYS